MAVIFAASAQPKLPDLAFLHIEVGGKDIGDKIGHLIAYAVLGALIWRALDRVSVGWGRVGAAVALATAYGVTDELHQLYVPGRDFDLVDLGANALGAALASVVLTLWKGGAGLGGRARRKEDPRGKGQAAG